MLGQLTNRNFYLMVFIDLVMFTMSLGLSYHSRLGFETGLRELLPVLPLALAVKSITFFLMGAYRGMWRYTSAHDILVLCRASLVATLVVVTGLTFVNRFGTAPRSAFISDFLFTCFLTSAVRGAIRMRFRPLRKLAPTVHRSRLLIIGAGDAADKIIREIQSNTTVPYFVVGCLDDDPEKRGRTLLGVPIYGPVNRLPALATSLRAEEVLIAIPSASGEVMRNLVALCERSGLRFRTLPPLAGLLDGRVSVNDLREVRFEDLLGRPPVKLNPELIGCTLAGKVVAVTGAGGSIGSELCRQIIRFNPAALVLVEASEFHLYRIEMELRTRYKFNRLTPVMCRVQDRNLLSHCFATHRPKVVFHAAACKHVPLMEENPWEAVFNNVVGSQVLMDTAEKYEAERCVIVSTDKAVRPTNVMGASKRSVEVLMQSRPASSTRFIAVRFGNVVGSSGSVIPLFQSQIRAGGPVTVTHPEMTRYFMTIPEACQLVLQAGSIGEGREIFILEMGTPIRIADLAHDLIKLSGKVPGRDIAIAFTGLRPGEKLYEELITQGEGIVPTTHEKIMVLRPFAPFSETAYQTLLTQVASLVEAASACDGSRIRAAFTALVPEYAPSAGEPLATVNTRSPS